MVQHIWEAIRQENTEKLVPVFDTQHRFLARAIWTLVHRAAVRMGQAIAHQLWLSMTAVGGHGSIRAGPRPRRSLGQKRPPRVRGALRLQGRGEEVPARLPDPADKRQNARAGGQGPKDRREQDQAGLPVEWMRAVNAHGGFGNWTSDISYDTADIEEILQRHCPIASYHPRTVASRHRARMASRRHGLQEW